MSATDPAMRDLHAARVMSFVRALILAATLLLPIGCGGSSDSASATDVSADSRTTEPWRFDTPQAFIEFAAAIDDERTAVDMFNHMYGRTTEEQWAIRFHRAAARAELEYRNAMRDAFGRDADEALGPMELIVLPTSRNASVESHGETRAIVRFPTDRADEGAVVVLARIRGAWTPHATTFTAGQDVSVLWCHARQAYYAARIQYCRDVAAEIRKRQFSTPQQAAAALTARLAGPPPARGTIQVD